MWPSKEAKVKEIREEIDKIFELNDEEKSKLSGNAIAYFNLFRSSINNLPSLQVKFKENE